MHLYASWVRVLAASVTATSKDQTVSDRPATVRDEKIPLELEQLVEALGKHRQQQKAIRDELDKDTLIPVGKTQVSTSDTVLKCSRVLSILFLWP